jgi:predicted NBD/HSP70 family sugar kinase
MVGAAHGIDHAVCLYVGFGIGAGLILNGELYAGANGNAGEIGMVLLPPTLRRPDQTSLEHRASLASLYQHLGADPSDPGLPERLNMLVNTGDPGHHASWIDAAAEELRWGVQIIETIFDPQTVILCCERTGSAHPLSPATGSHGLVTNRRQPRSPRTLKSKDIPKLSVDCKVARTPQPNRTASAASQILWS